MHRLYVQLRYKDQTFFSGHLQGRLSSVSSQFILCILFALLPSNSTLKAGLWGPWWILQLTEYFIVPLSKLLFFYIFPVMDSSASIRPTLPPLHSLNLPRALKTQPPRIDALHDSYELKRQIPRLHIPSSQYSHSHKNRQVSISSSTSSRTPSPTPSPLSSSRSPTSGGQSTKICLVPTTFEHADAVVVIPDPDAPHLHPLSGVTNLKQPAPPVLLVGPALQCLRQPQRQIAKGARLHPYRIVRTPADRKFSIASIRMRSRTLQ
ncbi:hypothetical protein F4604DRAFT_1809745 [Suillus subluteus]|nr:hypothetical protein F4604DRAFT_1809745 [Suillus subluteus]